MGKTDSRIISCAAGATVKLLKTKKIMSFYMLVRFQPVFIIFIGFPKYFDILVILCCKSSL